MEIKTKDIPKNKTILIGSILGGVISLCVVGAFVPSPVQPYIKDSVKVLLEFIKVILV